MSNKRTTPQDRSWGGYFVNLYVSPLPPRYRMANLYIATANLYVSSDDRMPVYIEPDDTTQPPTDIAPKQ